MNSIMWPAIVEIGLISYRSMNGIHFVPSTTRQQAPNFMGPLGTTQSQFEVNDGVKRPPLPSELLALMLIFGIFGVVSEHDSRIGGLLGWGVVIATGIVLFGPGATSPAYPNQPQAVPPTSGSIPPSFFGQPG